MEESALTDIRAEDMSLAQERITRDTVEETSTQLDEQGVHRPIKDGLVQDGREHLSEDENGEAKTDGNDEQDNDTSEEEREMPGVRRPKRGEGWWGRDRPLQPHRKGLNKDFGDGAGLASPGRWKVKDRRLPESEVAQELRKAIWSALRAMDKDLPGGSARSALALLMAGKMSSSPFPEKATENLREKLKDILEAFGLERSEGRPDDAEQLTDVRLLQAL